MHGNNNTSESDWTTQPGLEESTWHLGLSGRDSYPERYGEPNCVYYMRTGTCGYGSRCRFNHPRDRNSGSPASVVYVRDLGHGWVHGCILRESPVVVLSKGSTRQPRQHYQAVGAVIQGRVEYPEREGQPVCQYFLKTGTCKFGSSCKFHHPKYGGGSACPVSLNYHGYPLRPGEQECTYYAKTGQCKFGITCKFHHPPPAGTSVSAPAPPFYQTVQSTLVPSTQQYGGVSASWQVTRPPLLTGSYVQGTGSYVQGAYGHVLLPQGMVTISGWNPYSAPVSPIASPSTQSAVGAGPFYGVTQLSPSAPAYAGPYPSLSSSASPSSIIKKEGMFPERPGQPECQYYLRTGNCKFGSSCRYHHPPEPSTNCILSPMGLPLRLGAPPCSFYLQHGICKFGPACRYDHPMGTLSYSPSASSLADMPVAPYPIGSSLATLAPSSSSSDLRQELITGSNKDSIPPRIPSSENTSSGTVGSIYSRSGSIPPSNVQLSRRNSAPSSDNVTSQGSELRIVPIE